MRILDKQPWLINNGENQNPSRVNDNFQYLLDAHNDVFSKRYLHWATTFQFVPAVNDTLVNTDVDGYTDGYRLVSYELPLSSIDDGYGISIERAFVTSYHTSSSALDVQLQYDRVDSGIDWLSVDASTDNTAEYTDHSGRIISLGTEEFSQARLTIVPQGSPTYALSRFDVTVHFVSDRFNMDGYSYTTPSIDLFSEVDPISATTFLANRNSIQNAATANNAAGRQIRWQLFTAFNVSKNDTFKFKIPSNRSTEKRHSSFRLYAVASMASPGGTGDSVIWELQEPGGGTILETDLPLTGETQVRDLSGIFISPMTSSSADAESDITKDWTIQVTSTSDVEITKTYCYLIESEV